MATTDTLVGGVLALLLVAAAVAAIGPAAADVTDYEPTEPTTDRRPGADTAERPAPDADALAARLGDYFGLTDDQVAELAAVVERERAAGGDPAPVRAAVVETLRSFGVSDAELREARFQYRVHRLAERHDLTPAQRLELATEIRDMRRLGLRGLDLRAAAIAELDGFGADTSAERHRYWHARGDRSDDGSSTGADRDTASTEDGGDENEPDDADENAPEDGDA